MILQYIICNVSPYGDSQRVDIGISAEGDISQIRPAHTLIDESTIDELTKIIDASDYIVLPGLVDLHAHLREPGREDAETLLTGSYAAAAGGFTAVCAMPNTDPVADSPVITDYVYDKGQDLGIVDIYPIGAITQGQRGQRLAEMGLMHEGKAKVSIFSDDGYCVADSLVMRRALEYAKGIDSIIAQHAQEPQLTRLSVAHEGSVATKLGLTGWPRSAEEIIVARDIILAKEIGARIHFCHISTAGSVELIRRAKHDGVQVTAEVTPHHLLLDDSHLVDYDTVYKVNPPIREHSDIEALRQGLWDGTIDCVATDHAPHTAQDKICDFSCAKPGMIGLETALSVVADVYRQSYNDIDWGFIARIMSINPAKISRLDNHGRSIAEGEPANLVLIDPHTSWKVSQEDICSRSANSPYIGYHFTVRPIMTFLRGNITYSYGKTFDSYNDPQPKRFPKKK